MEKRTKSQTLPPPSKNNKSPPTVRQDSEDSICSTLSIEPFVNNIAHALFVSAVKQEREERRQAKVRQENKKSPTNLGRQTLVSKKKPLTMNDIDRLFEEKRVRPSAIKTDLTDLYQKSTGRVRALLNRNEIEQFLRTTQNRKIH